VLVVVALAGACSSPADSDEQAGAPTTTAPPPPEPDACAQRAPVAGEGAVVDALLAAFAARPVVAFAEHHRSADEHRVLQALLCDPRFPDAVDAVVVEFGNRRLQDVVDRYVSGGEVTGDELAAVWRESTQRSGVWEAPMYRQVFATARSINRGRAPEEQVRVLAGDPPIDWSTITETTDCDGTDPSCLEHWDREDSFVEVVLEEVLDRGRTALLIAGAGHLTRRLEPGPPPSISQRLEAAHPGSVTVVLPHDRFLHDDPVADAARAAATGPALLALAGSPLGGVDSCLVDDGPGCADHTMQELADAYLFVDGTAVEAAG
jgi:hypothetical protein